MAKYYHLFPFARVPYGARLALYGAGEVGQWYLSQLKQTGYAEVVAIADQAWEKYDSMSVPLIAPCELLKLDIDYVVVSIESRRVAQLVADMLERDYGLVSTKIILGCDSLCEQILPQKVGKRSNFFRHLMSKNEKSPLTKSNHEILPIAFRCGYGLGDTVIMRKACEAILSFAPAESYVDFFCESEKICEYVEVIFGTESYCHGVYLGQEYPSCREKYALVISGHRSLVIEQMNETWLSEVASDLLSAMRQVMEFDELYRREWNNVVLRNYALSHILGWDCYTCLGGGALPIHEKKVRLTLWPSAESEFHQMDLKDYITVNCGSGGLEGKHQVKEWPKEHMEEYICLVKERFPGLQIVQLGSSENQSLQGVDRNVLGEDLRVVEHILANSMLHVDCEGGLVHVASQLGTKCAVIFGPTDMAHFAYLENINICANICAPCCGAWMDENHCLRGYDDAPPCMWAVTASMVFDRTSAWLAGIKKYDRRYNE